MLPETKSKTMKSKEEKNKAIVLKAMDTLFNKRDFAAAQKYWSPTYIQHPKNNERGVR